MKDLYALVRHSVAGLRVLIAGTVLLGVVYPLVVTGIGRIAFPWQSAGSLVTATGAHTTNVAEAVGSALIGQVTRDPRLFYDRASYAGSGYDPTDTYGSNYGPDDPRLVRAIEQRRARIAARERVTPAQVPPDAVTASGSGLDPDISPAYAAIQVARVARANGLSVAEVRHLVAENTHGRELGFLGDPTVNVLLLNIAVVNAARAAG